MEAVVVFVVMFVVGFAILFWDQQSKGWPLDKD